MAFNSWILNQTPSSGGSSLYKIMTMLEGAGWIVTESSNGSSVSADNTSFSSGYNNAYAWFRILCPNGFSELGFQRGGSGEVYSYIKYSPGGFTSGGTATNLPSSVDQVVLFGSNNAGTQLFPNGGNYYLQGGADNGITAGDGYGFWVVGYGVDQIPKTCIIMEPVTQTDSSDTSIGQRYMFYIGFAGSSPGVFDNIHLGGVGAYGAPYWIGCLNSSTWTIIPANFIRSATGYTFGSNPHSGKDDRLPLLFCRRPALGGSFYGYKGISSMMMYEYCPRSTAQTKGNRTIITFSGDTTTKVSVSFPWDGTTVPKV